MLSEHERYDGLGMDALAVGCSWNTNVIMVWHGFSRDLICWIRKVMVALGTRRLLWFGHGCSGERMRWAHERYNGLGMGALAVRRSWNKSINSGLGMDALVIGCSWNGNYVILVLGMDSLAVGCSWNTNVIMVWAWMLYQVIVALGTRTL